MIPEEIRKIFEVKHNMPDPQLIELSKVVSELVSAVQKQQKLLETQHTINQMYARDMAAVSHAMCIVADKVGLKVIDAKSKMDS